MAYGSRCASMGKKGYPSGIIPFNSYIKKIRDRQIPLIIDVNGGVCHGVRWHNGKRWIAALRLGGILCVDPTTWVPEVLIRVSSEGKPRLHHLGVGNERSEG